MNCEDCDHKKFDHHVEGSPRAVYTCAHPLGLIGPDGEECPLEPLVSISDILKAGGRFVQREPTDEEIRNRVLPLDVFFPGKIKVITIEGTISLEPDAHEDASDIDIKCGKALERNMTTPPDIESDDSPWDVWRYKKD